MKIRMTIYLIIFFIIIYFLIVLASQLVINRMMFFPPHSYNDVPQIIKLKTSDGKMISALYLKNPEAKFTILYSHGNAEDLGRSYLHMAALKEKGFSVFGYDYHGYGTSEGKPTEKNVYRDINASYEYLTQTLKIPPERIILYGFSIGSGPTIDLAARKPVGGVILHSPLASVFRMLFHRSFLILDPFNNISKIDQISAPILLMHGKKDSTVPFWHSEALLKNIKSPVQTLFVENAAHNNLILIAGAAYWQAIQNFTSDSR